MKRIILTYTLAFSLLSASAGEGGSPPLKNTDKGLLIDYVGIRALASNTRWRCPPDRAPISRRP